MFVAFSFLTSLATSRCWHCHKMAALCHAIVETPQNRSHWCQHIIRHQHTWDTTWSDIAKFTHLFLHFILVTPAFVT